MDHCNTYTVSWVFRIYFSPSILLHIFTSTYIFRITFQSLSFVLLLLFFKFHCADFFSLQTSLVNGSCTFFSCWCATLFWPYLLVSILFTLSLRVIFFFQFRFIIVFSNVSYSGLFPSSLYLKSVSEVRSWLRYFSKNLLNNIILKSKFTNWIMITVQTNLDEWFGFVLLRSFSRNWITERTSLIL